MLSNLINFRIKFRQNDPNFKGKKDKEIFDIIKILKERQKRTVERKMKEGEDLIFCEKRGIINKNTEEVVFDLKQIYGEFDQENDIEEGKEGKDGDIDDEDYDDEEGEFEEEEESQ
jgi:hypothetical protein